MTLGHESQYQTAMSEIKLYFVGDLSINPFDIAEILRPLFQSLIHEIELKADSLKALQSSAASVKELCEKVLATA